METKKDKSLKSSKSENATLRYSKNMQSTSSLRSTNGVIVINPNGKLYHCINQKFKEKIKNEEEEKLIQHEEILNNFIEGNEEIYLNNDNRVEIENLIRKFSIHQYFMVFLLFLELANVIYFNIQSVNLRNNNYFKMTRFYPRVPIQSIVFIYWAIWVFEVIFCIFYFALGFFAAFKKSIKFLDLFNLICLIGLLTQMIQAFIQQFNPFSFCIRIFLFIHSKFICDLLIRLIFFVFYV